MFIFFRSSRTLCHSLHHGPIFIISVCSFYITTGRFMMMLWVFCGLYSPTWIFDFEGLRRVVMMIVCSEFFSKRSIKSYITNQQNKMYKDTLVRIFLFCFFFFIVALWPVFTDVNIWLWDCVGVEVMMIVCSVFFFLFDVLHVFKRIV